MGFCSLPDVVGGQIDEVQNEVVWRLRFDRKFLKDIRGEILQVVCDDDAGLPLNSSSQDMPVFGIRKV